MYACSLHAPAKALQTYFVRDIALRTYTLAVCLRCQDYRNGGSPPAWKAYYLTMLAHEAKLKQLLLDIFCRSIRLHFVWSVVNGSGQAYVLFSGARGVESFRQWAGKPANWMAPPGQVSGDMAVREPPEAASSGDMEIAQPWMWGIPPQQMYLKSKI